MHVPHAHIAKRQQPAIPTADGVGAIQTAAAGDSAASSLLLGGSNAAVTASVSLALAANGVTVTSTMSSTSTGASTPTGAAAASSGSSSSSLSTGAIVGIIIAAFAGFVFIMFVVYGSLRRRWAKALQKRSSPRSPSAAARNASGENARRRSRLEAWNKLDGSNEDHWEGKEKKVSMEEGENNRLSLFRKASSTRSGTEEKSTTTHQFDASTMPNFAKYHPDLAAQLATTPPARPFAGRADDSSNTISWDGQTVGGDSFLRLSDSSAMTPAATVKQTPPAITSTLHRWQSAEVLTMDVSDAVGTAADAAPVTNPFADDVAVEGRRAGGGGNPFFSAHPSSTNPFADPQTRSRKEPPPPPPPSTLKRTPSSDSIETIRAGPTRPDSTTRPDSNAQAMQSLLAVLDAAESSPKDQRASLQSSVVSASQYTDGDRTSMASFVTYTPKAM